jgi:5-methyltetrahydropteroyltriglutamate--homocysteine methyltransferase
MKRHILGFPRIGKKRELKKALEAYWKGELSAEMLNDVAATLKRSHWEIQRSSGLSYVTTGDFSFYDQTLDTAAMLGAVPERFGGISETVDLDTYFNMARGDAAKNIAAMEMTKWFNTNYHYIVPEIELAFAPRLSCGKIIEETTEAAALGYCPKPVLVGPITFLSLAKSVGGFNRFESLQDVVSVYVEVIHELRGMCEWIQIDEPILCADMCLEAQSGFAFTYRQLNEAAGSAKLLLTTYFDTLDDNLGLALSSGCAGLHVDLVRGQGALDFLLKELPSNMVLSAGVVEGRNVWKTDCRQALFTLERIEKTVGANRLLVGSSCSLLHSPVDLQFETQLDPELRDWMAFAVQKCDEVNLLADILEGKDRVDLLELNEDAIRNRRENSRLYNKTVRDRMAAVDENMLRRKVPYQERKQAQSWLDLPLFPTTTIGSFPQTPGIRAKRRQFVNGKISEEVYDSFIKHEITNTIKAQEALGLDVLVHGEAERNDMVEYFGEQMEGFCFTQNGWVQSYGSRCVKPPIIFGDVSRQKPMTVKWIQYAKSLTQKPMKGMLTGPVTILCWSFVRDDMDRAEVCGQIALAIRDEVLDLEAADIPIIQIDEAALSEGMPVKSRDRNDYLRWAVDAFRLATSGVKDSTQIHTHMCYSEFNAIIHAISEMDADVISIESSRSKMELLDAFVTFKYPNEIGPGVYDIHSPRVPSKTEIVELLIKAMERIPKERLWVNPDCGLKTRDWPEVKESLQNMVAAAASLRIAR